MKYQVWGTIEVNWSVVVEADSESDAERMAEMNAYEGQGWDEPVGKPEIDEISEWYEDETKIESGIPAQRD